MIYPFHKPLCKDVKFCWSDACESALIEAKLAILSEQNLGYLDPHLPLTLVCDASRIGLGAVLLHVLISHMC